MGNANVGRCETVIRAGIPLSGYLLFFSVLLIIGAKENTKMKKCLENVRKNVPLVHNITNYVTVNDVANILLACGGSPIMSDE